MRRRNVITQLLRDEFSKIIAIFSLGLVIPALLTYGIYKLDTYLLWFLPIALIIFIIAIKDITNVLIFMFLLLFFIPIAPTGIGIKELAYGGLLAINIFIMIVYLAKNKRKIPYNTIGLFITIFVLLVFASMLIGRTNGVSFSQWFRGALPFAQLILAIPIALLLDKHKFVTLFKWMFFISILFGLRNIQIAFSKGLTNVTSVQDVLGSRVTYDNLSTIDPFILVGLVLGLILAIYEQNKMMKYSYMIGSLLLALALSLTYARALFLSIFFVIILLFIFNRSYKSKSFRHVMIGITVLIVCMVYLTRNYLNFDLLLIVNAILERFTHSGDNGRSAEFLAFAYWFPKSPIFGHGLGHEVLIQITPTFYKQISYTHNFIIYFLMKMGIVGLIFYLALFITSLRECFYSFKVAGTHIEKFLAQAAFTMMASLMFYALFFATYRSLSFNLALAVVLGYSIKISLERNSKIE
jgi:O-antigen ligase